MHIIAWCGVALPASLSSNRDSFECARARSACACWGTVTLCLVAALTRMCLPVSLFLGVRAWACVRLRTVLLSSFASELLGCFVLGPCVRACA